MSHKKPRIITSLTMSDELETLLHEIEKDIKENKNLSHPITNLDELKHYFDEI